MFPLTIKAKHAETDAACSFILVPQSAHQTDFAYKAGQFLTFDIPHPSAPILRSYSLSSTPDIDPYMRICVKRVVKGRGSNWMIDHLHPGDVIWSSAPLGSFTLTSTQAPVLLIAGGSGITPCIGLIKQILVQTQRHVHLLYANQTQASVIYRRELDDLCERFSDRFACQHWIEADQGYVTAEAVVATSNRLLALGEMPDCYICGPGPLMDLVEAALADHLGEHATIAIERFASPQDGDSTADTARNPAEVVPVTSLVHPPIFELHLDGETHKIPLSAGHTLLEAALAAGIDAPKSCLEGHCGACMGHLKSGHVDMASTKALSKRNIKRGYVLACQARPSSIDPIHIDFDF